MIKIIFFDVDGTLLRMGEKNISDKTLYALKALKKKGILFTYSVKAGMILIHQNIYIK